MISTKVVLPNGEAKIFSGNDLDLISDVEGITGFICEVTLMIQKDEPLDVFSVGCKRHECFQRFLEEVLEADLPIWSIMFINPKMAELKNQAPLQTHHGKPVGEHVQLPEAYIITITSRVSDNEKVREKWKVFFLVLKRIF